MRFDVFISYRRDGGFETAWLLKKSLESKDIKVFLDVEELRSGLFDKRLLEEIARTPNYIIILHPGVLDRCQSQDDWLRQEIAQAIRTDRNIIPILKDEFEFPRTNQLPEDIRELPRHSGVPFNNLYFKAFIDVLIERLQPGDEKERNDAPDPFNQDPGAESRDYLDEALASLHSGKLEDALSLFQKSAVCQENFEAYYYSALTTVLLDGDLQAIQDSFERCLKINPEHGPSRDLLNEVFALREGRKSISGNKKASRDTLKNLARFHLEWGSEITRTKTVFEWFCPTPFQKHPYWFWTAAVTLYYSLRGGFTHMAGAGIMPPILALQWIISLFGIAFAYRLSRYYFDIYYCLKNQLEIRSRDRFRSWYVGRIQKALGYPPEGKTVAARCVDWIRKNKASFFGSLFLFLVGVISCSLLTDYSALRNPSRFSQVMDWSVVWAATLHSVWLAVTSFLILVDYSRFSLKPLVSRLNLFSVSGVAEMIVSLGFIIVGYYFFVSSLALLVFRDGTRLDLALQFLALGAAASWTLGLPLFLRNAFYQAKVRVINTYSRYTESAFDNLVNAPSAEALERYEWFLDSERRIRKIRTFLLPAKHIVFIAVLNLAALLIAAFYIWAKLGGYRWRLLSWLERLG